MEQLQADGLRAADSDALERVFLEQGLDPEKLMTQFISQKINKHLEKISREVERQNEIFPDEKVELAFSPTTTKKKRNEGLWSGQESDGASTEKRGRPKKAEAADASPGEVVPKRKRGRPKKVEAADASPGEVVPKRKRGRPKKVEAGDASPGEVVPKRKRGRPKKVDSHEAMAQKLRDEEKAKAEKEERDLVLMRLAKKIGGKQIDARFFKKATEIYSLVGEEPTAETEDLLLAKGILCLHIQDMAPSKIALIKRRRKAYQAINYDAFVNGEVKDPEKHPRQILVTLTAQRQKMLQTLGKKNNHSQDILASMLLDLELSKYFSSDALALYREKHYNDYSAVGDHEVRRGKLALQYSKYTSEDYVSDREELLKEDK